MEIFIECGDITRLHVDVVVNAASPLLLGGGGVDGAIHAAAGPGLLKECQDLDGCPVGRVRLTGGHDLPARHIIHAVGPRWRGDGLDDMGLLASCYRQALKMADGLGAKSIAFPAISTGIYGYPLEVACPVAAREVLAFQSVAKSLEMVILVAYDRRTQLALADALYPATTPG